MPVGTLSKMLAVLKDGMVHYALRLNDGVDGKSINLNLNSQLGKTITLDYQQAIYCSNCQRLTKKSYSQGHCYLCSQSLASCDLCIMKPETCHHHLGTCREPEWGLNNCFTPHVVYLANSSGVKVGITRATNIPTRFIDQGAISALPILSINTRLESGQLEEQFKKYIADKTNWRKMLKNEVDPVDLIAIKNELLPKINLLDATPINHDVIDIAYPVLEYPTKVGSLNFDKTPTVSGVLLGIKGQYLILDSGVINIRKFSSYHVEIKFA